jgi:tetratricopeptide (TPR) repeat protein/CHAT domain-containing protein
MPLARIGARNLQEAAMFKRFVLITSIAVGICVSVSSPLMAQSKEAGVKLFNEAKMIDDKARTNEDLEKAIEKYEQALRIFEKVKFGKGIGWAGNNLGMIYAGRGQDAKAVECYEKSLAAKRALQDRRGEGKTLNNLANVFRNWGQYEKAKEAYEKSLAISRELHDARDEAIALNNLGIVYKDWGQLARSHELFEKSVDICRKLKDRRGEGETLMNLGLIHKEWGQYDKAVELYGRSLAICKALNDRRRRARTLLNLGHVYYAWGKYDRARGAYEESLAIRVDVNDRLGEGISLMSLGLVYKDLGQYKKARAFYEKSLGIFRELKNLRNESITLNNLGDLCREQGQYAKAVAYYENGLSIKEAMKDLRGLGFSFNGLGDVYKEWGQYTRAMASYQKALAIRQELKSPDGESQSLNGLANLCAASGQYSKAMDLYEQSLAIKQKLQDRRGEAAVLIDIGRLHQQMDHWDKAVHNFSMASRIFNEIKVPTVGPKGLLAATYLDMGQIDHAQTLLRELASEYEEHPSKESYWGIEARLNLVNGNSNSALELYKQVLLSAEKSRNADLLSSTCTGLGLVYEALGENSSAAEYYLQSVNFTEDLRSSLSRSERENFFGVRVEGFGRVAPYKGLARVLMRLGKPTEAFQRSEYTKARVFAEALSLWSEEKRLDVPPDVLARDVELADQLAALKKARQKGYERENKEILAALDPQVKDVEQKFAEHLTMLRENYPLFAATKYPEPMDLSHAAFKDDEWALVYDVTDSGFLVYLTKGKNLIKSVFRPLPAKDLEGIVEKFRHPVELGPADSTSEKIRTFDFASGKKLSDLLLGDILSELPKNAPLIIIPDGPLGVLPFEMLVLNDGGKVDTDKSIPHVTGAEFFGDRNPISYYQSVTALTLARTLGKKQMPAERTLAMVDPVFSADDPRLVKAAAEERRAALDKLTGEKLMSFKSELSLEIPRLPLTSQLGDSLKKADPEKTDLFEGLGAQKAVLLQKDLKPYRSVVFGTHGYFGKDLPGVQEPVLILTLPGQPEGQDGFLRMTEVMGLKLNCDIAALTACQTGLGRHISGEGTMGMGRAFQYAGAKSVLMSLWSVSETASVNLVESFFKHLKEGKSKLEALRLAREEIRKAGYDHPFYWAPFILVGEVK